MKENVNTTTLTPQEMSELTHICLNIENLEEQASRCDSLVDIFAEALESMHRNGTQPIDGATYGNVAEIIREYSLKTKGGIGEIHEWLSTFIKNIRSKGGECHE